jgi:hypothetical protein
MSSPASNRSSKIFVFMERHLLWPGGSYGPTAHEPRDARVPSPMRHLTDQVVAFRVARDWSRFHSLKDEVMSVLVEAGE